MDSNPAPRNKRHGETAVPILTPARLYPGQWVVWYMGRRRGVYATLDLALLAWPTALIDYHYRP